MNIFIKLLCVMSLVFCSLSAFSREYITFGPQSVTVADGYLQIRVPDTLKDHLALSACPNKKTIVVPNSHTYFDQYLSIAMAALLADKPLTAAISAPCLGSPEWHQMSVLSIAK